MMTWCIRGAAAAGLALVTLMPQVASAHDYPYCVQGRRWGYPGNCQFQTYEQCQATASGTDDYCGVNPRAAFAEQWDRRGHRPPPRRSW
jgi:hypothetical protein